MSGLIPADKRAPSSRVLFWRDVLVLYNLVVGAQPLHILVLEVDAALERRRKVEIRPASHLASQRLHRLVHLCDRALHRVQHRVLLLDLTCYYLVFLFAFQLVRLVRLECPVVENLVMHILAMHEGHGNVALVIV